MKCTRQRCQVAHNTLVMAAFSPSCASETTSLTPRRPRRARLRQTLGGRSGGPLTHSSYTTRGDTASGRALRWHRGQVVRLSFIMPISFHNSANQPLPAPGLASAAFF